MGKEHDELMNVARKGKEFWEEQRERARKRLDECDFTISEWDVEIEKLERE